MAKNFPFVGGSYTSRSLRFDAQRTLNLYPEVSESGPGPSRAVVALIGRPGLKQWGDFPGGPIRGTLRYSNAIAVVVSGPKVYRVATNGIGTVCGYVPNDGLPVAMASNGDTVFIGTTQGSRAINIFTGVTTDLGIATNSMWFIDGRIVANRNGTGQFVYTEVADTPFLPLNFETAEGSPDNLVSLVVVHREVWLFNETTTEIWGPTGDNSAPFARIGNAFIETGIAAARSVGKMDNTVYWLSADDRGQGIVMRANGYTPQRVSTHAIEFQIASYSRIDDAVAYTYQQEGHSFYVLTFPTAKRTWCFDSRSGMWHERSYRRPIDGVEEHVREWCQMAFAGKVLVGDRSRGTVYEADLDVYTDAGDLITALRSAPHLHADGHRRQYYGLELIMETGIGDGSQLDKTATLDTVFLDGNGQTLLDGNGNVINGPTVVVTGTVPGPGNDPQVRLRWSDDGGYTWRTGEKWAPAGRIGERQRRVRFRRLGSAYDRVFEVSMTDPVRRCFIAALLLDPSGA